MWNTYDDHGIRFEYPLGWELDESSDEGRTTLALQSSGGTAFALVTLDDTCPEPSDLADEALQAMKDEYPGLDAAPALESIDGHHAVGHDLEFLALDVANSSTIRCFRTPRRTIFVFAQWSDLDGEEPEALLATVRRSIEETDAG
ncbi:MAG TPA: hypothetical protein VFT74_04920 [Isosphaeraceae bacterium]|nr:hypothetical protein [Isosphaeraceae bacterium]